MPDTANQRQDQVVGEVASGLPEANLPAATYQDLPEPLPLKKIAGTSVIILATALGSGEYITWPFITSQVGFTVIWAAVLAFLLQYFINMEVERYTLATGETAITGFTRLWRPWGILFVAMAIIPNFWPGWATGSATSLTYVLGLAEGTVVPITILALIAIGIALTVSPVVYQTVEKLQVLMVTLIAIYIVIATVVVVDAGTWGEFGTSMTVGFGQGLPDAVDQIGATVLLGAIAFAGAGGVNNLVQSNWIRDKGMGMGTRIPNIVSPFTGQEESRPGTGYMMRTDEENMRRWRGWWKVANKEQFITFFLLGVGSLVLLSALTYSTVFGEVQEGQTDFAFIRLQGEVLNETIAPWFGTLFWLAGVFALFSTNLGILDYVSRATADVLKVDFLRQSRFWSESKLYLTTVWAMIAVSSLVLLSGLSEPLTLIIISSAISGGVMVIYTILLIMINRRFLPQQIKLEGYRLVAMCAAFVFFAFFTGWVLVAYAGQMFGG